MGSVKSHSYGWKDARPLDAHDYLIPAVVSVFPRGISLAVLDLGCGNGVIASEIAKRGHRVTGIDASTDGIMYATSAYRDVSFFVRSVYESFTDLSGRYDVVVSSEVIEHLYYPRKLLATAFEVLKPGGALILTTPYHGYLKNLAISILGLWDSHHDVTWDGGHIKFFSKRTLGEMIVDAGFEEALFAYCGRMRWLWKSMVCIAKKPLL